MEKFSLSLIDIELKAPFRYQKCIKLKNMLELIKSSEMRKDLFVFLYNFFIDCVTYGNKAIYINDEVIFWDKEKKIFRYDKQGLNHVCFDYKSIIYLHPSYVHGSERELKNKKRNLKYILWSIGCLVLNYIFHIASEDMLKIHNNYQKQDIMRSLACLNLRECERDFILQCLTYREDLEFIALYVSLRNFYDMDPNVTDKACNIHKNTKMQIYTKDKSETINTDKHKAEASPVENSARSNRFYGDITNPYPNFRQCPYCSYYIENSSLSKFVTCHSIICKGNKYFCWNCNHKLYIIDKDKHFDDYGLYSNYCANIKPKIEN